MTFSYTQVSQYLRCPRSYRFRYLDGWREKESRAALCFGRCFEKAVAALFEHEDAGAVLFKQWGMYRDVPLEYSHGDDWERYFARESVCWSSSLEIIESAFASPNATCKRSLSDRYQTAMSLWPMSMQSATWTAHGVCLSGKPRVLVTPSNPRG